MAAKSGDTVKVHYTGKLPDGSVFDSSEGRAPIEFTIGQGQVIPGFEAGVVGMNPGDHKTFEIVSDQAYGPRAPDRMLTVPKEQLPDGMEPQVGQRLEVRQANGPAIPVQVTDIDESQITLDANHPLAGQNLTFETQLVEIV